jgi:enterochelin esterase-like enzyme
MIGGFSLGGLAATHAGLRRPDIFGKVLRADGTYPELFDKRPNYNKEDDIKNKMRPEDLDRVLAEHLNTNEEFRKAQNFIITYSLVPCKPLLYPDETKDYLAANNRLKEELETHKSKVTLKPMPLGHTPLHWQVVLHDALIEVFRRKEPKPQKTSLKGCEDEVALELRKPISGEQLP